VPIVIYIILIWLRKRKAHAQKKISNAHMTYENISAIIALICALWFRMIFVVDAFENVIGHTLGFFGLQLSLTLVLLSNLAYHIAMGTLRMPVWIALFHAGATIGTTVTKIMLATSVFVGNPIYLVGDQSSNNIAHFIDLAWMFLQAFVPLILSFFNRQTTPPVVFTIQNTQYWGSNKTASGTSKPAAESAKPAEGDKAKDESEKPKEGAEGDKAKEKPADPKPADAADPKPADATPPAEEKKQEPKPDEPGEVEKEAPTIPNSFLPAAKDDVEAVLNHFLPQNINPNRKFLEFTEKGISIVVNSETVRLFSYVMFWSMVIFAVIITKITIEDSEITDSPLVKTFGFNNVCIFWDYTPARELTAMFYPMVEVPLLTYLGLNFLRKRQAFWAKHIPNWEMNGETILFPILVIMVLWFRMIFVVEAFFNVVGHTLGFFGLQFALLLVLVSNFGYHFAHGTLAGPKLFAALYLVAAFIVTIIKITLATSVFVGSPVYAVGTTGGNAFAHFIDISWMVLQAVLPAIYSFLNRRKTPDTVIHMSFD
jgi:hypothetical protein